MNFFAPFRIALRALAANTLRSVLTMLGLSLIHISEPTRPY